MHTEAFSTSYVCLPCENTDSPADATVENIADFLDKEAIPTPTQVDMDHETSALTPRGEYLRWHHRLGHLSFKKMTLLSILGILPRKLIKVRPPVGVGIASLSKTSAIFSTVAVAGELVFSQGRHT